jgi:hypothetical protein
MPISPLYVYEIYTRLIHCYHQPTPDLGQIVFKKLGFHILFTRKLFLIPSCVWMGLIPGLALCT